MEFSGTVAQVRARRTLPNNAAPKFAPKQSPNNKLEHDYTTLKFLICTFVTISIRVVLLLGFKEKGLQMFIVELKVRVQLIVSSLLF